MADMEEWPIELQAIWEDLEQAAWSPEDREHWVNEAADLFEAGWIEFEGKSTEELDAIRDEFFALMEEYDVSIEDFDWDEWRDWYAAS